MRLGVLLSLQLSHMILEIHTFCAVLGCQSGQSETQNGGDVCYCYFADYFCGNLKDIGQ